MLRDARASADCNGMDLTGGHHPVIGGARNAERFTQFVNAVRPAGNSWLASSDLMHMRHPVRFVMSLNKPINNEHLAQSGAAGRKVAQGR